MRSNRHTPNQVLAPGENRRDVITLTLDPTTLRKFRDNNSNSKIGEYCGLVHGNIMELGPEGRLVAGGTNGLMDAVALYQGLTRPLDDADGSHVYIYVTNPLHSYTYPASTEHADLGPQRVPKPARSAVFTTMVDLEAKLIVFWEWTMAGDNPGLPDNADLRYGRKVW